MCRFVRCVSVLFCMSVFMRCAPVVCVSVFLCVVSVRWVPAVCVFACLSVCVCSFRLLASISVVLFACVRARTHARACVRACEVHSSDRVVCERVCVCVCVEEWIC